MCGICTGPHKTHENMVQLEYTKGLLDAGEQPRVKVTVDDELSSHLIKRLKEMGVNKVNVVKDHRTTEKKVKTLLERT